MSTMRSPEHPDMCLPSSSAEDEKDKAVDPRGLVPFASPSLLAGRLRFLHAYQRSVMPGRRRKREMTPAEKKDASYWDKRRKNNEAAKRSREKRRLNDLMLEGQLQALSEENTQLRAEVLSLSQYYVGLGWGTTARHPLHPGATLHCPAPPHLQPSVWGLSAGQPPSGCCQDLCQLWPQPGPYSSSPSTSSTQLFSHLRGSQGYGPPVPCALGLDRLEEAPGQADSTAPQQVSSSSDPDGKRELSPAPSMCPASSSPAGDLDAPSDQNWLLTGLSNPGNQYSKLLVPWSSPCKRPSSPITCWPPALPLPIRDAGRTNLGISSVWNFSNKFRMLSAEISQMRRYLKPDNA